MPDRSEGSVVARLRQAMRVSGMSRYELSRQAHVDQSVLSRFVRGVGGISVDNLERVARALGLEVVIRPQEGHFMVAADHGRTPADQNSMPARSPGSEARPSRLSFDSERGR